MGFMDRIKDGARRADSRINAGIGGALEHRERAIKLNARGVNHPATIKAIAATGRTDPGGGKETEFTVDVDPGEASYEASFSQYVVAGEIGQIGPGSRITVRVDPGDPSTMMFWGAS